MTGMVVRGPRDVPALRTYMLEHWRPGGPYAAVSAARDRASPGVYVGSRQELMRSNVATETHCVAQASLFWVSSEMVDVMVAAAKNVPDDVRIADLPELAPFGLVVFDKPWTGSDADTGDTDIEVHAMTWGRTVMNPTRSRPESVPCLSISCYRRVVFEEGMGPDVTALMTATGMIGEGRRIPLPNSDHIKGDHFRIEGTVWVYLGRSDWPKADELGQSPYPELTEQQRLCYVEDRRIIAALFTLVKQESIAQTEYHPIERSERRRAERAGVLPKANDLRVITLRRAHRDVAEDADDGGEGSGRRYSHRWVVNPFYRWQRVGPGRSERRLTLVSGHVRGPSDKPLKVKQEVRAWVRQ